MISWSDIVKGAKTPVIIKEKVHVIIDLESSICPRCGHNWDICPRCGINWDKHNNCCGEYDYDICDVEYDYDNRSLTKMRWFSVSCGYDMKTKFPIKHGGEFNWEYCAQEKMYTITICGKCRSDFFEPVRKNWWWCNSEEYYKEFKKFEYQHDPIYPNDHTYHSELQGYVPQPKFQVDYSADIHLCGRCHVGTNIVCTVKLDSKRVSFNNGLTTKDKQQYQPYEFFTALGYRPIKCGYGTTGPYKIKLCTCCRDDLVDCMLNEWWNKEK